MDPIYLFSLPYLLIGAVCLFLALRSRNPTHLGAAVGRLDESKKVMRYRYKRSKHREPATACTYLYEVGGKTYKLKHSGFFSRSSLMRRVTVVYLHGLPRFGFLERYPAWQFTLVGTSFLAMGAFILLAPYL